MRCVRWFIFVVKAKEVMVCYKADLWPAQSTDKINNLLVCRHRQDIPPAPGDDLQVPPTSSDSRLCYAGPVPQKGKMQLGSKILSIFV